jgi:hypothetical protein
MISDSSKTFLRTPDKEGLSLPARLFLTSRGPKTSMAAVLSHFRNPGTQLS